MSGAQDIQHKSSNYLKVCPFSNLVNAEPSSNTTYMVNMLARKCHLPVSSSIIHLANHTPVPEYKIKPSELLIKPNTNAVSDQGRTIVYRGHQ
jgi:hypothetical protein